MPSLIRAEKVVKADKSKARSLLIAIENALMKRKFLPKFLRKFFLRDFQHQT